MTISNISCSQVKTVDLDIIYNNYKIQDNLINKGGFSCLVKTPEHVILFDAGLHPKVHMHNIEEMNVDIQSIEEVVISHANRDHTYGLDTILYTVKNDLMVYLPEPYPNDQIDAIKEEI